MTMLRLSDIMTADLVTLSPQTSVRDAMELLGRHHLSGAPVVAGGTLVGVVTTTDLMTLASTLPGAPTDRDLGEEWSLWPEPPVASELDAELEPAGAYFADLWDNAGADVTTRMVSMSGPEWNALEEHDVSEAMTCAPLATLPPTADVHLAADVMQRRGIHRVLVTEGERLVGIVSALDITRAVAQHKLTERTYVFGHSTHADGRR
jgi:CBS domain-containing protein